MSASLKEKIAQVLVSQNILTEDNLKKALLLQKQNSLPLREILLKEKFIDEYKLMSVLSKSLYIPTLKLSKYRIDKSLVNLIPEKLARQYQLVPVSRIGDTLTVAVADPLNIFALDDLRVLTGLKIDLVITSQKDIKDAIDNIYRGGTENITDLIEEEAKGSAAFNSSEQELELDKLKDETLSAPIVKLVNLIIIDAFKKRASDIHIEPEENDLRVRFRIDGELVESFSIPRNTQNAVVARIKIISGLDITETRLPQDGRFKVRYNNKEVDFRVSSLPISDGQKLVLRVLDKTMLSSGIEALGFSTDTYNLLKESIAKPYGMILVTGPTGSGKSTTLYSVLRQLNTLDRNIVTIEDPVEYQVEGITQIQANTEIGLTFASGLRSILRQSPDVILIGEIRDSQTADIAIKAALTGQLVMSTLHTNNAAGAVTRLIDMGIEPFLVGSSLIMSSAQRLIRLNCSRCKESYVPDKALLERLNIKPGHTFYRGKGCDYCNNSGFYGRAAILEILVFDYKIREMVAKGCSCEKIQGYAVKELRMRTLHDEALDKAMAGLTTLEEILRVTSEE